MEQKVIADVITMIRAREHRRQIESDFAIARDLRELLMALEVKYPSGYSGDTNTEWKLSEGFASLTEGYITTFYPLLRDGEESRFIPSDSGWNISVVDGVINLSGMLRPTEAFKSPIDAALYVFDFKIRDEQRKEFVERLKAATPASADTKP